MSSVVENGVLLSWVDLRTDPYDRRAEARGGEATAGPTLTLLFDPDSPYRGKINQAYLFYRKPPSGPRAHEDFAVADATRKEIERLGVKQRINVELVPWEGQDPTDHRGIFEFLDPKVSAICERFLDEQLVIHISPGTPAMQTVWVLMAEMGLIREPSTVVKSLPRAYRAGRPAVVPVSLDIPTLYKVFQQAQPRQVASMEEEVLLNPRHFVSEKLTRLYADARRFAQLNVPILVLGERGTGKTTLASWIRSNSPFRESEKDHSWPSVPCSQYSPETMRAELFGYVKGAFTDAKKDTEGLLHVADGDTLFLDEIGDIPRDLQRLLIRALEEKRFTRVGARVPEESDFRLITATNLPWGDLKQRLDPDFLDRISVMILEMPPLREIRDDLPWLWQHVYQQALRRTALEPGRIHLEAAHHERIVQSLMTHPLSGNLRDLFRVAYHLIAAALEDAPDEATKYAVAEGLSQPSSKPSGTLAKSVAAAFSNDEPLDAFISSASPLATKTVERALRKFLAEEIRRIARMNGGKPQDLCDVTDRTLQQWVKIE